jgi:site-specific recombinase XerD
VTRHDPRQGLPPFAIEYLGQASSSALVVRRFHAWLRHSGRPILQLESTEIDQFIAPFLAGQKPHAGTQRRRRLFRYLGWLHARNLLRFDPRRVWPDFSEGRVLFELPAPALQFIRTLEPTLKPSTIDTYRSSIGHFHMWLDSQGLPLNTVDRAQVSAWFAWLHARKFSAGHRILVILAVRAYFQWLNEQPDYTGNSVDYLFRRGDLPKRPEYLPRPIPADLDSTLQRRLRKSDSPVQLGLLLMRRTGLRIGELRMLPFHCVHADHLGNNFLKVPLGKLNTERLVPLDRSTMRLIKKLRVVGSTGRRGERRMLLLQNNTGKPLAFSEYRAALKQACRGLVFAEPMTSHRLRHTYATSMLAAGVSLPVLMKLLGHRDYHMTLRYAAITPETLAKEYASAAQVIAQRYDLSTRGTPATASPDHALADFARYVLKHADDNALDQKEARILVRRLNRLNAAIQRLFRSNPPRRTR